jgi:hypothetical protein
MKIRRCLIQICLLGTLLSAASTCSVLAQVLFFDNFQQFANGTDLTSTNYPPSYGPATASVVTSVQNGSPAITVSNFLGSTWALFNNSVPTNKNQYEEILSSVPTNQPLQVTWNMWIQATNTGPGMFLLSVPTSDPNANFNPLILFTDTGSIIALTNGTSLQVPIGNWGSLAGTVITNKLVLDYPDGIFSYSLNGQPLATLPLGPYFTNVVGAIYFNGFERSAGSLGNRFAIADVEVEAFTPSNIFTYTTNNDTITITGYSGTNTTVIIPGAINGLPVTGIGSYAFENQTSLMSVTIPNRVTCIGLYAFFGSGLTSLTIGSSVTNLGVGAFADCRSLTNVTIPGNVASLGGYAFENDPGLTQAYFLGNAPGADSTVFSGDPGTVYYVPGTIGWTNPFGGLSTVPWYQRNPVILGSGYGLGAQTNGFGFTVSWATNLPVIVEASTNLAIPVWTPLATNTLSNGFFYFVDPAWTNYPSRFYRIAGTNAVAFFTASPIYGQMPLTVQFNPANVDSLGNPITHWNWNFGDGATSTAQNPSHSYTNIGPFNPVFAATNNYGSVVAGYGPQITLFTFITTTNNGAMTITGFVSRGVGAVTIPGTINGLPVTSIGAAAFSSCTNITSVTIPNTVTNIGQAAFYDCPGLMSVTISNGVTSIGDDAFSSCGNLSRVVMGNSVTNIGNYAFAFCTSLTGITIPGGVTSIGADAFGYCSGLTNVTIPNGVTGIAEGAFEYCTNLTSVTIPGSVTSIGAYAFENCTSLTSVTAPNGVTNIGDQAFNGCSGLALVYFQGDAPGLGLDVFTGDTATVYYLTSTTGWASTFGGLPTAEWNYLLTVNNGMNTIAEYLGSGGAVTIPGTINGLPVTSIGAAAFSSCTNITSVTIPNTVTNLGQAAFYDCPSLMSVTIPNTITSIGDFAFSSCGSLGSVVFGNSVTNVGNFAFAFCTNLTSATIPVSITGIGTAAFHSCDSLTNVTIAGGNIGDDAFGFCGSLSGVMIGNSVTNIGDLAFSFCTNLTGIAIPNGVLSIGDSAFYSCDSLAGATIAGGNIGDSAFSACGGLNSVVISNGVADIGDGAFGYCSGLTSVTIPGSVTDIGGGAFSSCDNLTSVTIGSGVNRIGSRAFFNDYNLQAAYFQGNAPVLTGVEDLFYGVNTAVAIIYYLPGTTGWSSNFAGLPAVLWNPVMQTKDGSFGLRSNQFGFDITGTVNTPIVVEACTNLANPTWAPLLTGTLTNGSLYFGDPAWTHYPRRFYRISSR